MKRAARTPPRAPSHAGASSRERLLGAAKSLFASRGYENASTAAIARLAGTSESQLIKHFGSKEGLLEAIFEQFWDKLSSSLRHAFRNRTHPFEKFRTLADLTVAALLRDAELKQLLLLEGRHIRKDGHMILLTQGFLEFVRIADELLEAMRQAGQLRSDLHLEGMRSALIGALEGMLRDQIVARRIPYPAHYTTRQAQEVFRVLLGSFFVSGAVPLPEDKGPSA